MFTIDSTDEFTTMSALERMQFAITIDNPDMLRHLALNDEDWRVRAAACANDSIDLAVVLGVAQGRSPVGAPEQDPFVVQAATDAAARRLYSDGGVAA